MKRLFLQQMNKGFKYLIYIGLVISLTAYGAKIKKGFEALEIFNYFEAKRLFEKSLKKHPVASSYGLSIIYARKDNPFSNLDSAYSKIIVSLEGYTDLKPQLKDQYKKVGVDSLLIYRQRDIVSTLFYTRALEVNSIFGFQDFIDKNYWSEDVDSAIYKRDRLAFEAAVQSGESTDFSAFLSTYPGSEFTVQATDKFHATVYSEQTYSNKFIDYVNFVKSNPDSPFRDEAEDKIYEKSTTTGTVQGYKNFIVEFPSNRNVETAWIHLFNARMQERYAPETILAFTEEFPNYPFKGELLKEYSMADKVFYPVRNKNGWGFCDKDGNLIVDNKYEAVEWFTEGLSVVRKGNKFGFINKLGNMMIHPQFDDAFPFKEGFALVEVDELWGIIDRNGDYIIPAQYEDLGVMNEGLCYFQEKEYYGYMDTKGRIRLQAQFSEAYDFDDGLAVVSKNDYFGLIDPFGTTFLPFKYQSLNQHSNGIYVAELKDTLGLINLKGDTLLGFAYDFIGKPKDGLSIVERDGEFNFLNDSMQFIFSDWIETYSEYKQLAKFINGFAKIEYEKGFNLCDTTGGKLLKRDLADIGFYSHLIAAKKGDAWGYINSAGQTKIDYEFEYAQSFIGSSAIIRMDPFYGLINQKGDYLIQPYQEELKFVNDTVLIAKSVGKYGLLSVQGDTLLNYQYINIEPIDASVVKIEEEGDVFYYNIPKKQFIRKEE